MRIIKKLFSWLAGALFLLIMIAIGLYLLVYDSRAEFMEDYNSARRWATLKLYNVGYVNELSHKEVRHLYQQKCYRQCHGEAAMITAVLTDAGWFQIVERMRVKENVEITGHEADAIIKFLEDKYPSQQTGYSYDVRKKVHHAVWRNDVGQGDIYVDVIYATPIYLKSIGADHLIKEYGVKDYHVFIVSFSVHEGELEQRDLDEVIHMRSPKGTFNTEPPWILRFETADKHHYEGVVRFPRKGSPPIVDAADGWFELLIKNVGGAGERIYHWDIPIQYPQEALEEMKRADA